MYTEELASFRQQWKEELGLVTPTQHRDENRHQPLQLGDKDRHQAMVPLQLGDEDRHEAKVPLQLGDEDRHQVKVLLQLGDKDRHQAKVPVQLGDEDRHQAEAAGLYLMGVAAEHHGDMHGAITYYRQAVQLVPDIEFKVSPKEEPKPAHSEDRKSSDVSVAGLRESFETLALGVVCKPWRVCKEVHISALPAEVLHYIFRWVVSAQLDMRALEQLSAVCRGFYLLAREPDLWRRACRRLWGDCSPTAYEGDWRSMFIHRPHLDFNGVYISKTTYVRPGERSLDRLYKAYHTVTYYRYFRFFPDGAVMYQTSPEEPALVVGKLAHMHSSAAVLLGHYSVQGNTVTVDVSSYRSHIPVNVHMRHRRQKADITHEDRFHMELLLKASSRQTFNQLQWQQHYCHSLHRPSGHVQVSHFTIDYKYTPFFFSRVRSFTSNSHRLLT